MIDSQPVRWWRLINELEAFRTRTGYGLAGVWGYVHRGAYDDAVTLFAEIRDGYWKTEHARTGAALAALTEDQVSALAARTTAGTDELPSIPGALATFGGMLSEIERVATEDGEPYAVAVLSDRTGCAPLTVAPDVYQIVGVDLRDDRPVLVKGIVAHGTGEPSIVVTDLHTPDLDQPSPPLRRVRPLSEYERSVTR